MCHEYGWTLDQCFDITKEQIEMLVESISKRKKQGLEFNAQLHNCKLKNASSSTHSIDSSEDFDKLKQKGII